MFIDQTPSVSIRSYIAQIGNDAGRITVALPGRRETRAALSYTRADYGFTHGRLFWLCPSCRVRTERLYWLDGEGWKCRDCHGLEYRVNHLSRAQRTVRRAEKIRRELGGDGGLLLPFPGKPAQLTARRYATARIQDQHIKQRHKRLLLSEREASDEDKRQMATDN